MKMYFIGIDVGTSSVKIVAIDEKGKIVDSVSREYNIYFPKKLWAEQNPLEWWEQTFDGLKALFDKIDKTKVKAMSLSGQMHGLVTLDKNDEIIRPAILWNDQRTEKQCEYLNEKIGKENLSKWTGNIALTGFTAPKILWMRENEENNFKRIDKIMLPKDYIAYRLTGQFTTDFSDASGTLYLDVENKVWSKEMMKILGINDDQLPKLYNSFDVIGTVKEDIAKKLGINEDVKVAIGGGDQSVAAIGGGVVNKNECSVSLGTSGVIYSNLDEFRMDKENRLHSFCNGVGSYHVMGVTLSAAASLKWWVEKINETYDYEKILSECQNIVPDKDIYFLPYLTGERTPINDSNARGVFIGMSATTERGNMTLAVLEGVAFSLRDTFEIMKEIDLNISEITINGGGARNELWCQVISDVLNVRVKKVNSNDGPAYGAAILAAVAFGVFNDVEEACSEFIEETKSFSPNIENVEIYNRKYKNYKKIYPCLKDWFKIIN